MRTAFFAAALFATAAMTAVPAAAEMNFGNAKPNPVKPFVETPVATFNFPWAIAFLPDGHMLVTEKPGKIFLVSQTGQKLEVSGVPAVQYEGQGGLLDVAISPHYATDHAVYRRGLEFLIKTQRADGSWFVKSRSRPFQPYFESGFPHGPDQFISAAATGWAVAALALACPSP